MKKRRSKKKKNEPYPLPSPQLIRMPHRPRIHRIPRRALAQSPGRVEGAGLVNEDLDFPFAACFDDPFVCFGLGALCQP
jgi:hypothetical protein